jgi:hypothetical protein
MSGSGTPNEEGKGTKRKYIIIIIAAVVVIAAMAGVIIFLLTQRSQQKTPANSGIESNEEGKRSVVVTADNVEEMVEEMTSREPVQPGYYTVAMTTEWHFEDSKSVSYDAYVKNKPDNSNDVYFDLFLKDDLEEPIYESPIIPLGAELDQISLNRELPAGEYECVMKYHLVDEDQNTLDTLTVTQKVIIEN